MSREQGPRKTGMRPAAIAAGRRPWFGLSDEYGSEAAS